MLDLADFVTCHGWAVIVDEKKADGDLHDVVADGCFKALPFRNMVSFEFVFGRVYPVTVKYLVGIEEMEECSCNDIND